MFGHESLVLVVIEPDQLVCFGDHQQCLVEVLVVVVVVAKCRSKLVFRWNTKSRNWIAKTSPVSASTYIRAWKRFQRTRGRWIWKHDKTKEILHSKDFLLFSLAAIEGKATSNIQEICFCFAFACGGCVREMLIADWDCFTALHCTCRCRVLLMLLLQTEFRFRKTPNTHTPTGTTTRTHTRIAAQPADVERQCCH